MSRVLEVFFDYACPYCGQAHVMLMELLRERPGVEVRWRPCEAHPRPERYGPHSDLCIRGMFFARSRGEDLARYHRRAYELALGRRVDVEDPAALAGALADVTDGPGLMAALAAGEYEAELARANAYAYEDSGVWVVPAYRMDGRRLDATEDVGVTAGQLKAFLEG